MRPPTSYSALVDRILELINIAIPLILGFLFLYLVWKIVDAWVINAGDENKREEGRQYAVAAVVVFVVMSIAWGIVAMLRSSIFGL